MTAILVLPKRFEDGRGWFSETWHELQYAGLGINSNFCQDNHSLSLHAGTIRGLHFQRAPYAQAKLVRCLRGSILDVAVDVRRASPTFGHWVRAELSATNGKQLFIPAGYAHGFQTLEDGSEVAYKVDAYYAPEADGGIAWNDPDIGIGWQLAGLKPLLSDKDNALPLLKTAELDFQYDGKPLLPLMEPQF